MQEDVIPVGLVGNLNKQVVPEPTQEPTQNRENAIATTEGTETNVQADARGGGGLQRIRRPPTRLAYGDLGQPTDSCMG